MDSITKPARILVVEDDAASREVFQKRLVEKGCRVEVAESGESCLKLLSNDSNFDVVLLDIGLPGADGVEVTKLIRQTKTRNELPIIMVTAMKDTHDVIQGLAAGANDYVTKPARLSILLARISVAVTIKRSMERLIAAEHQRGTIESLGEACNELVQPVTAVINKLDMLSKQVPPGSNELAEGLQTVKAWTNDVAAILHRLQKAGAERKEPFIKPPNQRLMTADSTVHGDFTFF